MRYVDKNHRHKLNLNNVHNAMLFTIVQLNAKEVIGKFIKIFALVLKSLYKIKWSRKHYAMIILKQ